MGKYNFDSYNRIKALEDRNAQLIAQNNELAKHLESLTQIVNELRSERDQNLKACDRSLYSAVDKEVYTELFGCAVSKSGEVVKGTPKDVCQNFSIFHRNVLKLVIPCVKHYDEKHQVRIRLRAKNLEDMTEEEYKVARDLIARITKICYEARMKLKEDTESCSSET